MIQMMMTAIMISIIIIIVVIMFIAIIIVIFIIAVVVVVLLITLIISNHIALVYHSKYAFQILWKNQSDFILLKALENDILIFKLYFWQV